MKRYALLFVAVMLFIPMGNPAYRVDIVNVSATSFSALPNELGFTINISATNMSGITGSFKCNISTSPSDPYINPSGTQRTEVSVPLASGNGTIYRSIQLGAYALNATHTLSVTCKNNSLSAPRDFSDSQAFRIGKVNKSVLVSFSTSLAYLDKGGNKTITATITSHLNYRSFAAMSVPRNAQLLPKNLSYLFTPQLVLLKPGASNTTSFRITANKSATSNYGSSPYFVRVNASAGKANSSSYVVVYIYPGHNFTLKALGLRQKTSVPGTSAYFNFTVNNTGEAETDYALSATPGNASWTCAPIGGAVTVPAGQKKKIAVSFSAPLTAGYMEKTGCTLSVTDEFGLRKNISFNLTADRYYKLSAKSRSYYDEFDDGSVTFRMNISNDGNTKLKYNLSINSSTANWNVSVGKRTDKFPSNPLYFRNQSSLQNFTLTTINVTVEKPHNTKCGDNTTLTVKLASSKTSTVTKSISVEYPCLTAVPALTHNLTSKGLIFTVPGVAKGGSPVSASEVDVTIRIIGPSGKRLHNQTSLELGQEYPVDVSNESRWESGNYTMLVYIEDKGSPSVNNTIRAPFDLRRGMSASASPESFSKARGEKFTSLVTLRYNGKWYDPSASFDPQEYGEDAFTGCGFNGSGADNRAYVCDIWGSASPRFYTVSLTFSRSKCSDSPLIDCSYDVPLSCSADIFVDVEAGGEEQTPLTQGAAQQDAAPENSENKPLGPAKIAIENIRQGDLISNTDVLRKGFDVVIRNSGGNGSVTASLVELGALIHFDLDIKYNESILENSTSTVTIYAAQVKHAKPGAYNLMLKVNGATVTFKVPVEEPRDNKMWHRYFELAKNGSTIVTLRVKNVREGMNNFSVTEEIPKEAARSMSGVFVISPKDFAVIKNDPVVKWSVQDIRPGRTFDIIYMIGRNVTGIAFPDPQITEAFKYSGTGLAEKTEIAVAELSDDPLSLLVILGVLVSASLWFFMYRKGMLEDFSRPYPRKAGALKRQAARFEDVPQNVMMQYSLDANKARHSVSGNVLTEYCLNNPEKCAPSPHDVHEPSAAGAAKAPRAWKNAPVPEKPRQKIRLKLPRISMPVVRRPGKRKAQKAKAGKPARIPAKSPIRLPKFSIKLKRRPKPQYRQPAIDKGEALGVISDALGFARKRMKKRRPRA